MRIITVGQAAQKSKQTGDAGGVVHDPYWFGADMHKIFLTLGVDEKCTKPSLKINREYRESLQSQFHECGIFLRAAWHWLGILMKS